MITWPPRGPLPKGLVKGDQPLNNQLPLTGQRVDAVKRCMSNADLLALIYSAHSSKAAEEALMEEAGTNGHTPDHEEALMEQGWPIREATGFVYHTDWLSRLEQTVAKLVANDKRYDEEIGPLVSPCDYDDYGDEW